ncbi:MAG: 50S ribosomal protein L30 [Fibrobacter sp.]|nr:50S ribosomal protein L30 [Fibrobacter sp.]
MAKKLKVTQVRSTIGTLQDQKRTIRALGLGKINSEIIHNDTAAIRGMINNVKHLVKVVEVDGE